MLLEHAKECGAEVHEQTTGNRLINGEERVVGVEATGPDGKAYEVRAKLVVDASGKDAFASRQRGWGCSAL
jgi:flavin-dependent dehydrogenase